MLSAPSPYPTVSSSIPAPDDAQIVPSHRLPSICVDYLSHKWARDEDVWNSWKAMTKSKNEIANGVRLENASWRTWMKQMRKLKTVSPETLNWLKDSDVTWLYGPLHQGQVEAVPPPKIASAAERLDLVENSPRPGIKSNAKSTSAQALPRSQLSDLRPSNGKNSPSPNNSPSPAQIAAGNSSSSSAAKAAGAQSTAAQASKPDSVASAGAGAASSAFMKKKAPAYPNRVNSDGTISPPATKSILKHRTIQDLLSNPQANSAAGLGSTFSLRSASQPSLPELEAAAAATSLALREGQGEAVLSPAQTRALGLGLDSTGGQDSSSHVNGGGITSPSLTSPTDSSSADGLISPPAVHGAGSSSASLASDAEAASSLKSPTASAASLVSLSSTGSGAGTPTTAGALKGGSHTSMHPQPPTKRERRHISFNQRVEQCIALDMDQAQDYPSSADEYNRNHNEYEGGHGEYGFGDDDDDEDGAMWRSGPGQRVQRGHRYLRNSSGHDDEDDEEEMLTINVRSSAGGFASGRPGSSSGGSSTSATSYSNRSRSSVGTGPGKHQYHSGQHSAHYQLPHHHQPRTIAKLAPTMLRGGSAQPETGEWLDHEHADADAHDVDLNAGLLSTGVGTGANAHVPAYVHNPIVDVSHRYQQGTIVGDLEDDEHGHPHEDEGDDIVVEDEDGAGPDGRGRAHGASALYSSSPVASGVASGGGRVHQSRRYPTGHQRHFGAGGNGADSSEDGSSDWERRTSLDLASPPFPGSPRADEEDWEGHEHASGGPDGVPADEMELRAQARASGEGADGVSGRGSGGRSRTGGSGSGASASSSSSAFWADGNARGGPPSPASSTSSSYSTGRGGGGGGGKSRLAGGSRRQATAAEVAEVDKAVHGVLSIDVDNVPSNDPNSPVNPAHGPTPLNTPTFLLGGKPGKGASASAAAKSHRHGSGRRSGSGSQSAVSASSSAFDEDEDDEADYDPAVAGLPHRRTSTGALVAPKNRQVQVPLAHDYVDEGDEGGLINRAVEMINTARDLFGALWGAGDSDRGRSWRDSTYES